MKKFKRISYKIKNVEKKMRDKSRILILYYVINQPYSIITFLTSFSSPITRQAR